MTKIPTASKLLEQKKSDYFGNTDVKAETQRTGEERRKRILDEVERLLSEAYGATTKAMWLSGEFWTADEGRMPIRKPHPLLETSAKQKLNEGQRQELEWIMEVAGLCHDLSLHFQFDLNEAFGIKNDFWVSNKQLVEWLNATPYEQIAMHTAYTMRKVAINTYAYGHYLPAQDHLAELYSMEYRQLVRSPERTEIPPRDYVKTILEALSQIERHWKQGRRRKLRPDLVMLHDEIYGLMPLQFSSMVLRAAQTLYDYMDSELCGRLLLKDYNYEASWSEQPELVKRTTTEVMGRFANKVREVREQYLAKGWLEDDSLAFSYLMDHASRCGYGFWREEDDAL